MSNRLPVLAAEIRKAHSDVQDAAKTAAERAIEAGHALLEAKELVKHGEWLPWLRENCALAERTAQLYMAIAKNGASPEVIAAIGLQGAAQVLGTIYTPDYDPWCKCTDEGKRDFHIFMLFLVVECGWYPEGAWCHTEWILQGGVSSPDDWISCERWLRWRRTCGCEEFSAGLVSHWRRFLAENQHRTVEDLTIELDRVHQERGPQTYAPPRRRRKSATIADLAGSAS